MARKERFVIERRTHYTGPYIWFVFDRQPGPWQTGYEWFWSEEEAARFIAHRSAR